MTLFKNKYRIESARLQTWDYAANGFYFITICTHNREWFLGKITNGKMKLSPIGAAAQKYWLDIPNHFPFVKLDAFTIMPNHVHGIFIIDKPDGGRGNANVNVETQDFASLQPQHPAQPAVPQPKNKFGPQSKNIASIIRGFKIGVTKFAKSQNIPFGWQPRFYDHIVRNEKDLNRIRQYIINNPAKWQDDTFYLQENSL